MKPERTAFLCGVAWLKECPGQAPTDNELASLCDDGSLEFAKACVPVAEACAWLAQGRALRAEDDQ